MKSKGAQREATHRWYIQNREKVLAQVKEYRKYHKEELSRKARARRRRIRLEVLSAYSGGMPKCTWCGTKDIDVLCIDHIEGGGTDWWKNTKHWGDKLYNLLRRESFPSGFQVLCANCNMKKEHIRLQEFVEGSYKVWR